MRGNLKPTDIKFAIEKRKQNTQILRNHKDNAELLFKTTLDGIGKNGLNSLATLVKLMSCFDGYLIQKFFDQARATKGRDYLEYFKAFMRYRWEFPVEVIQKSEAQQALSSLSRDDLLRAVMARSRDQVMEIIEGAAISEPKVDLTPKSNILPLNAAIPL